MEPLTLLLAKAKEKTNNFQAEYVHQHTYGGEDNP